MPPHRRSSRPPSPTLATGHLRKHARHITVAARLGASAPAAGRPEGRSGAASSRQRPFAPSMGSCVRCVSADYNQLVCTFECISCSATQAPYFAKETTGKRVCGEVPWTAVASMRASDLCHEQNARFFATPPESCEQTRLHDRIDVRKQIKVGDTKVPQLQRAKQDKGRHEFRA